MSNWLDFSNNSNKFKQSYFGGFIDISGGNINLRNDGQIELYNKTDLLNPKFSIKSDKMNIYDGISSYYDVSNSQLIYLKNVSGDIQTQINKLNTLTQFMNSDSSSGSFQLGITNLTGLVNIKGGLILSSDASFDAGLYIAGKTLVNNDVSINGNLYANYPINSIPSNAINGGTLKVGASTNRSISGEIYSSINTLLFDTDSGFVVDPSNSGTAIVSMNSTFKYWDISGQTTGNLVANGLDKVVFVAGNNIAISTNPKTTNETNNSLTITTVNVMDTTTDQTVSGNKTFANNTIINGNLSVGTNTTIGGNLLINDNFYLLGDASFNGNILLSGDISINGNIRFPLGSINPNSITGGTVGVFIGAAEKVTFDDDLFALVQKGPVKGEVATDAVFDKNITVLGDASLNGNTYLTNVIVSNDLSVSGILTAVTVTNTDNSNKVATTAYVKNQGYATPETLFRQFLQ